MSMFDFSSTNILSALRALCSKLVLKGESQQVDRIIDAFSKRWCECNPNHGFKNAGMYRELLNGNRQAYIMNHRRRTHDCVLCFVTQHRFAHG